uniref:Uncharacterized protein n=1 Tax=Anguilla anguilla TaxID=7936 RepID=A0A0E9WEQ8_ANGAN
MGKDCNHLLPGDGGIGKYIGLCSPGVKATLSDIGDMHLGYMNFRIFSKRVQKTL